MPRIVPVLAAAGSAVIVSLVLHEMREPPARPKFSAMPRPVVDDTPHPSGRPHINDCPLRYGIGADVEAMWASAR